MKQSNSIFQSNLNKQESNHSSLSIITSRIPQDFDHVPLHYQDYMEFILMKSGSGFIRIKEEEYIANKGDIYYISPGTLHSIRKRSNYQMEYDNVLLPLDLLPKLDFAIGSGCISPLTVGYPEISNTFTRIDQLLRFKRSGYETGIRGLFMVLLYDIYQISTDSLTADSKESRRIKEILQFIDEHYTEDISVEMVAESAGISAGHFMKIFKEQTDDTLMNYIIRKRLNLASELLINGDDKIVDIAYECGYDNLANFNRQFKRNFGVTPSKYRQTANYHS